MWRTTLEIGGEMTKKSNAEKFEQLVEKRKLGNGQQ